MTAGTSPGNAHSVAEEVAALCLRLEATEPSVADRVRAIRERLEGPLRVAIAGRVKVGKSTLVNSLVGERLAPTDAGECTRIVTEYRHGDMYSVEAHLRRGTRQALDFRRADGALDIDLGRLAEADIAMLEVRWPASTLRQLSLVDTPGLESVHAETSRRTVDFLSLGATESGPGDADAVIYLMRHVHADDVAFLDAFFDRTVAAASPVNAVAVLSRADEIGAGRLDAMQSARRIARRYEQDPQLRPLCSAVIPVAGLLAETGLTLREDEAAALRLLASTDADQLERMLLCVDELLELSASELTVELRRHLLDRLGMFGLRLALAEVASGATTAATLGPRLVEHSGLPRLRQLLAERFVPQARVLQARTALMALRRLVRELTADQAQLASDLQRELERIESSTLAFARLRAAHLVATGAVGASEADRAQLERLFLVPGPAGLGLDGATISEVQAGALAGVTHWRTRGADPLADRVWAEVCETAARSCEAIYAATLSSTSSAAPE